MGAGLFCFVLCQITILSFWHDSLSCQSHAKQRFQAFRHDRLSRGSHAQQHFFSCGMTNLPFPNSRINHYGQKEKKHQKNTVKIGKTWKAMLKINIFYGQKDKNNTKIP